MDAGRLSDHGFPNVLGPALGLQPREVVANSGARQTALGRRRLPSSPPTA